MSRLEAQTSGTWGSWGRHQTPKRLILHLEPGSYSHLDPSFPIFRYNIENYDATLSFSPTPLTSHWLHLSFPRSNVICPRCGEGCTKFPDQGEPQDGDTRVPDSSSLTDYTARTLYIILPILRSELLFSFLLIISSRTFYSEVNLLLEGQKTPSILRCQKVYR